MFEADTIKVVIDDREFTRWSSYEISTDIFAPPSSFALEIGKVDSETLAILEEGAPLDIYIVADGQDQHLLRGRINSREHSYGKGSHNVTISGYDYAYELQASSAPFDLEVRERQFLDVVSDLISPWEIPVTVSNEANRYLLSNKNLYKRKIGAAKTEYNNRVTDLQKENATEEGFKTACKREKIPTPPHVHGGIVKKFKDAKVDPGESVWDFIERIANKAEVFLWMSPDGWLTIQRPQYEQEPLYILSHRPDVPEQNNVKEASEKKDIDGIPTELFVHGRVREKGKKRTNHQVNHISLVTTDAVNKYGLYRPVSIKDKDARTPDELDEAAYYALKEAEKNYRVYSYKVAGHSQLRYGGERYVWATDTVAKVVDDTFEINEMLYISAVTYRRSRTGNSPGPQETELTLTPLWVWIPKQD